MSPILIADSGSTKTEWCLVDDKKKKKFVTAGLSPYFVTSAQALNIITGEVWPKIKNTTPQSIYFYGTGCSNPVNAKMLSGY